MKPTVEPFVPPGDFAAELKYLRTRLGISQRMVGELVGVPTDTISKWEQGQRRPLAVTAASVLAHLRTYAFLHR